MAWNLPSLPGVGTIATVANWATKVRDSLRYLKGMDGAVTLSDALILPDGAGYYIHIPNLTTTQRDALTPTAGMLIYNSTTTQFNKYENGAWRADLGFNSHHGDLSGLTDDDHTQYQKESLLTTAGDMVYATGASTWARLGLGTAGQRLRVNAGTTAPEWAATGQTQEFFVPVWATASTNMPTDYGILLNDIGDSAAACAILVPQDFTAISSIQLIFVPQETGASMYFDITTVYSSYAGGEAANVHVETATARNIGATTSNQNLAHSISDLVDVAALVAGDLLSVSIGYNATAIDSNAFVRGIRFKYT